MSNSEKILKTISKLIENGILSSKDITIKTGIILSLTTYWGVILVGTFITFN